jgi:ABC-type transporter Mla MlaB component
MLRITPTQAGATTTLKLEGSVSGPWVDELQRCWTQLGEEGGRVEVDLRGVSYSDPNGAALLLRMERQGSRLLGSSLVLKDLLQTEALLCDARPRKSSKREN